MKANQQIWGLLGDHEVQRPMAIWPGYRGHTSTLFEGHPGIFNDHRESGPRFNVSSEGQCLLTV